MTPPPIGTRISITVKHARLMTKRGYFLGIECGKWLVRENKDGTFRTWRFGSKDVRKWTEIRVHRKAHQHDAGKQESRR